MSEKTEEPTHKKIEDSRKKGQVSQSQDVHKLLVLCVVLELFMTLSDTGLEKLKAIVLYPVTLVNSDFEHALNQALYVSLSEGFLFSSIFVFVAVLTRMVSGWIQFGFLITPESLKPDLKKLDPVTNLKQLFSAKKMFELFTNFLKANLIAILVFYLLKNMLPGILLLPNIGIHMLASSTLELFQNLSRICILILFVIAVFDYFMQKRFYIKGLRMSIDDIKQEYKNSEGDPMVKGQRKQLAQEIANEDPSPSAEGSVDQADVVLVNPIHFATALSYQVDKVPLPLIVAKGRDEEAIALIQKAHRLKIPVIKNITLARSLYANSKVNNVIPRESIQLIGALYGLLESLDMADEHGKIIDFDDLLQ